MEAIFKISSSEFNEELFTRIQAFVAGFKNAEIAISFKDPSSTENGVPLTIEELNRICHDAVGDKTAVEYFKTVETDMSDFKFNRDEANER